MQQGAADTTSVHLALVENTAGEELTATGDERLHDDSVVALDITDTLPAGEGSVTILLVGANTYVKLPAKLNTSGKPWLLVTSTSSNPAVQALAPSIQSARSSGSLSNYTAFAMAASSVTVVGPQTVGGTPTTHYHVVVDPTKLPDSNPGKSALVASGVTSVPVDLYLDAHGRPIEVDETIEISGQQTTSKISLSRYNQPVTITAPPADQVGTG
jgi:hypothetical protein